MGVKIAITKPELYAPGQYRVKVIGNELNKNKPGKITVKFVITDGQYVGRTLGRNYNMVISPSSHLGKLLLTCGVSLDNATNGQQLDLDVINGTELVATLSHFTGNNGTVNSLDDFRRFVGSGQPQPYQPAPAQLQSTPQPSTPAPAATYQPQPPAAAPAPAYQPQPSLGPKLSF